MIALVLVFFLFILFEMRYFYESLNLTPLVTHQSLSYFCSPLEVLCCYVCACLRLTNGALQTEHAAQKQSNKCVSENIRTNVTHLPPH